MSHEVDDTYDIYEEPLLRARKQHRCSACGETISVGHIYARVFILFDHAKETVKRCLRCQEIHLHLRDLGEWESWPDERLACGLDYESEWGHPPPEEIVELCFLTPDQVQERLGKT